MIVSYIELMDLATTSFWRLNQANDLIVECIKQLEGTEYSNVVATLKKVSENLEDPIHFSYELCPSTEIDDDDYEWDGELKKLMGALQDYFDKDHKHYINELVKKNVHC